VTYHQSAVHGLGAGGGVGWFAEVPGGVAEPFRVEHDSGVTFE
jgi:hypothetical protein